MTKSVQEYAGDFNGGAKTGTVVSGEIEVKTPRQLLRESLERNAEEVASWPSWMKAAISTKGIFSVPPPED